MIDTLLRASIEGAILAIAVFLLIRFAPRLSPAVKALLWWCVAAKFVVALLPFNGIRLPVLPANARAAGRMSMPFVVEQRTSSDPSIAQQHNVSQSSAPRSGRSAPEIASAAGTWSKLDAIWSSTASISVTTVAGTIVLALWLIGLAIAAARTAIGWRHTKHVVARSHQGSDAAQMLVAEVAKLLGMRSSAEVRFSTEVDSPLIAGIRKPVILVPEDRFPRMSSEHQRMVICHELVHLKRRDVLFSCIPAIAERLFFFHPLTRLAAREYGFWREAACDAAVMNALGTPAGSYGRLLLNLGVSRQPTLAVANAAMSFSTLKRRLVMLEVPFRQSAGVRAAAATAIALALVAIVPVKLVARQVTEKPTQQKTIERERVREAKRQVIEARRPASAGTIAAESKLAEDRELAEIKAVSEAREAVMEQEQKVSSILREERAVIEERPAAVREHVKIAERPIAAQELAEIAERPVAAQERMAYVMFIDENTTNMSGSSRDVQRAREFRERGEPLLWFRLDGREYIVRDPLVLREVQEVWEPVSRIGQEQGRIGEKQGAIGARQGELAGRQGELAAEQGVLAARQGTLAARHGVLSSREARRLSEDERAELARERARLDREMRDLDREIRDLSDRMRQYDRPMNNLGDEMSQLGREMSALGRQMSDAARRAERDMARLLDRAIDSGAARPVR